MGVWIRSRCSTGDGEVQYLGNRQYVPFVSGVTPGTMEVEMSQLEIRGIIAAIDFSDWTRPVLQMAAELAAKYEAPLTAMYAELFVMTAAEQGGGGYVRPGPGGA